MQLASKIDLQNYKFMLCDKIFVQELKIQINVQMGIKII